MFHTDYRPALIRELNGTEDIRVLLTGPGSRYLQDKDRIWDKEVELGLVIWSFLSSLGLTEKVLGFVSAA